MKIMSDLVVGNAILSALDNGKDELMFCDFKKYAEELNKSLELKKENLSAVVSPADVCDTLCSFKRYCEISVPENNDDNIIVMIKHETRENLAKALIAYFRSATPDTILSLLPTTI